MGRINQLAEKTTLNSTDVIAVDAGAGGNTNKMTGANLAGQLKTLGNYQDKLTFDSTPTAGSTNPVTSGGVKTALDGKQNTLTFDTTPTAGSTNPVTSGGIANAIQQSTATGGYRSTIPAGSNLNDYTTAGAYIVENDAIAAQITNMPRSASGRLIVIYNGYTESGYYLTQVYLPSTPNTTIYVRTKATSNWTGWQTFAMDKYVVHSGTATTSATGTASFTNTYNTDEYACISIFTTSAVSGYLLLPYKYGDAANGRWGFKAVTSGTMAAIASTSVSYVALMYKYV